MIRTFHWLFSSLHVALLLLLALCGLSMIGTLIPQGLETVEYLHLFPRAGNLILATGADDLYHGGVFALLLGWLFVSALICTLTRLGRTRNRIFRRLLLAGPLEISSLPVQRSLPTSVFGTNGALVNGAASGLADPETKIGSGWQSKTCGDGTRLFLRTGGGASLLGGVLIHVGLLGILLGGLIDSRFGVETMIRGSEGQEVSVPGVEAIRAAARADRLSRLARGIKQFNAADPRLPGIASEVEQLSAFYQDDLGRSPLKMRFDKLEMDFHESANKQDAQTVKNWTSAITLMLSGTAVATSVIRVNQPFSFGDYAFFQSDWKQHFTEVELQVTPTDASGTVLPGGVAQPMVVKVAARVKPDWSPYTFTLLEFWPDFKIMGGRFVSISDELNNPAAQMAVHDASGTLIGRAWAFSQAMAEVAGHSSNVPFRFVIGGAMPGFESGLQVTSYPGTPLVWLGCFLFSLGMALGFYLAYIEEWLVVRIDGTALLAVTGNRHPLALTRKLADLSRELGVEKDETTGGSVTI